MFAPRQGTGSMVYANNQQELHRIPLTHGPPTQAAPLNSPALHQQYTAYDLNPNYNGAPHQPPSGSLYTTNGPIPSPHSSTYISPHLQPPINQPHPSYNEASQLTVEQAIARSLPPGLGNTAPRYQPPPQPSFPQSSREIPGGPPYYARPPSRQYEGVPIGVLDSRGLQAMGPGMVSNPALVVGGDGSGRIRTITTSGNGSEFGGPDGTSAGWIHKGTGELDSRQHLHSFILDYLRKQGFHAAAYALQQDIPDISLPSPSGHRNPSNRPYPNRLEDHHSQGSSPDFDSSSLATSLQIETPTGFLFDWWSVFWDVLQARNGKGPALSAKAFTEATNAAVESTARAMPAPFRRNVERSGNSDGSLPNSPIGQQKLPDINQPQFSSHNHPQQYSQAPRGGGIPQPLPSPRLPLQPQHQPSIAQAQAHTVAQAQAHQQQQQQAMKQGSSHQQAMQQQQQHQQQQAMQQSRAAVQLQERNQFVQQGPLSAGVQANAMPRQTRRGALAPPSPSHMPTSQQAARTNSNGPPVMMHPQSQLIAQRQRQQEQVQQARQTQQAQAQAQAHAQAQAQAQAQVQAQALHQRNVQVAQMQHQAHQQHKQPQQQQQHQPHPSFQQQYQSHPQLPNSAPLHISTSFDQNYASPVHSNSPVPHIQRPQSRPQSALDIHLAGSPAAIPLSNGRPVSSPYPTTPFPVQGPEGSEFPISPSKRFQAVPLGIGNPGIAQQMPGASPQPYNSQAINYRNPQNPQQVAQHTSPSFSTYSNQPGQYAPAQYSSPVPPHAPSPYHVEIPPQSGSPNLSAFPAKFSPKDYVGESPSFSAVPYAANSGLSPRPPSTGPVRKDLNARQHPQMQLGQMPPPFVPPSSHQSRAKATVTTPGGFAPVNLETSSAQGSANIKRKRDATDTQIKKRPTTLSAKRTQSSTTISQIPGADLPVIGSDYLPSPSVSGDVEVSSTSSNAHGSLATGFPPVIPTEGIDSLFGSNLSIPSGAVEPFDFDLYMSFPGDGSAHSTSFADTKLQDAFEPSAFD